MVKFMRGLTFSSIFPDTKHLRDELMDFSKNFIKSDEKNCLRFGFADPCRRLTQQVSCLRASVC